MPKERFSKEVARALARLYDRPYLETCPLVALISDDQPAAAPDGRALRRALLDAIELLRPANGTSSEDVAWCPYRIMVSRYVERVSRIELENQLCLGKSQYYREHRRALEALCTIMARRWRVEEPRVGSAADPSANGLALARDELEEVARQETPEPVQVTQVLRDIEALLSAGLRGSAITLHLSLPPELVWVQARPSVFRQGLLIPLSDLTGQLTGGRITIELRGESDSVRVNVHIEAGDAPLWPSKSQEVSRAFVEAAGGTIAFERSESACHLRLAFPSLIARRTVLLVDNNRELAALFVRYLEHEPWLLVYAESVSQALELCQRRRPALILLDVLMPGQDGWHLLTRLKEAPATADIPVVICSILDQPQLALSLGAVGYLRKPVTPASLREALQRWGQPPSR